MKRKDGAIIFCAFKTVMFRQKINSNYKQRLFGKNPEKPDNFTTCMNRVKCTAVSYFLSTNKSEIL